MMKYFSFLFIAVMTLVSCSTLSPDKAHNSRNSLDWAGVYTGTLPCADCGGIQTVLRINANNRYELEQAYIDRTGVSNIQEGTFTWDKNGGKIILNSDDKDIPPFQFFVGENHLVQLNAKGKVIKGKIGSHYILKKESNPLVEKRWKLIEIDGRKAAKTQESEQDAHFVLKAFGSKVVGNSGCNTFFGTYEISGPLQIRFSPLGMTRKACFGKNDETALMNALALADNYTIYNDTLSLNKARMMPLAKFVAVGF